MNRGVRALCFFLTLCSWPVAGRADGKVCAELLAVLRRRARPPHHWTAGSLAPGLRALVAAARTPGRLHEDARVFSVTTRAWTTPVHEASATARAAADLLDSRLVFDRDALLELIDEHPGAILMHTHPLELHAREARHLGLRTGTPADDYLHILNSLPSFEDVKLATLLTVRGRYRPRFWIVSPRYVLAVSIDPARPHPASAHAGLFSDLLAQIDLVDQRGLSFAGEDVLRVVHKRWPAVRIRLVRAADDALSGKNPPFSVK